jgi:hypothetical protein
MSHKDGRVILSAWVDPALRDQARVAAKSAGLNFSRWIGRVVQRAVTEESARRETMAAVHRSTREDARARLDSI